MARQRETPALPSFIFAWAGKRSGHSRATLPEISDGLRKADVQRIIRR
jgi:hypothetical protein